MFYVYILKSEKFDKFYIGYTSNLEDRINRHKHGRSKYTSSILPVDLIYFETFETKSLALKREKEIKRYKSHKYIQKLIERPY